MNHVRVHYNSSKPARLGALAYTQGAEIHVGPGQERHLPHEGWHVAQQMQGRVKPTMQAKGVAINDDQALEHEADVMGARALQMRDSTEKASAPLPIRGAPAGRSGVILQPKAEVKITDRGLELGREHDLKRFVELSFITAEGGGTQAEKKRQNIYRHMDSQATRRGGLANVLNFYLKQNPIVESAQALCQELQPRVDEWEGQIETQGGQFLGNSARNTAISSEYDSMVLELLILGREIGDGAIMHDLTMNVRNTAFMILKDKDPENIPTLLKTDSEEDLFRDILPIFPKAIESSIEGTVAKLEAGKNTGVQSGDLDAKKQMTIKLLLEAVQNNGVYALNVFQKAVADTLAVVPEEYEETYSDDEGYDLEDEGEDDMNYDDMDL